MGNHLLLVAACFFGMIVLLRRGAPSLCLPVSYLFNLLLIHLPGALTHWATRGEYGDSTCTIEGFRLTTWGVAAFVGGVVVMRWFRKKRPMAEAEELPAGQLPTPIGLFVMGWVFLLLIVPVAGKIPSVSAVVHGASAVWILGVIGGMRAGIGRLPYWLAVILLYPAYTILVMGFMGYGVLGVSLALAPLLRTWKTPLLWIPTLLLALYGGMSFYVSYVINRTELRDAVWGQETMATRIAAASRIFTDIVPVDFQDPDHFYFIDIRLNQNDLVGEAAIRIRNGEVEARHGMSFWDGAVAVVPRILWPGKPVVAGSADVVSEMTGRYFAEGTSVGIGHVMEFDINFGLAGVIAGFLILGLVMEALDVAAARSLEAKRYDLAVVPFLVAVAICQPGGSMVELTASVASAWIAGKLWGAWLRAWPKTSRAFGTAGRR